jgi:type IV secretion system protein VirB4
MLEQATGQGTGIVFDKDAGGELLVLMTGGRYLKLRRGQPSGLAPLRALENTPADRSWLLNTLRGLIELDTRGPLRPDEEMRLARGIGRQMQMPPELRCFAGIREMLGYSDQNGAGYRFEKWCGIGSMAWLFDNEEDLIRQDGHLLGYDFTELLPSDENLSDDGAAEAAASYIMHRARDLMDGRRLWAFCDEARFYMQTLGRILEDVALTGRKKELMLWIAAQEPEHLLNHPQGASLVSQCRTIIAFPNAQANRRGYIEGLRFTEPEFAKVTGDMLVGGGRRFLLKRESGSVICNYDLSPLPHHLKVLSARVGTTLLAEQLVERLGRDPAVLWPAFRAAAEVPPAPKPRFLEAAE